MGSQLVAVRLIEDGRCIGAGQKTPHSTNSSQLATLYVHFDKADAFTTELDEQIVHSDGLDPHRLNIRPSFGVCVDDMSKGTIRKEIHYSGTIAYGSVDNAQMEEAVS